MNLHIIFGQRKCSYEGEYAPEALDIADEYTMDANPEWLQERLKIHRQDNSFDSVGILIVKVSDSAIDKVLYPKLETMGEII